MSTIVIIATGLLPSLRTPFGRRPSIRSPFSPENALLSLTRGLNKLKSVAIIQGGVELDRSTAKYSLIMEVKDFSGEYRLHDAFMIDGIEYSDNGKFNDEIANDGIYTSVNQYDLEASVVNKLINNYYIHAGSNFAYESELEDYVSARPTFGVSAGCNVRLVDCPETSWYNDCWFGSPCT